jgi:hypothetical protein
MNIFKKIFGQQAENENPGEKDNKSPYTPDSSLPIEEQFILSFKKNGGKFIYCTNIGEVHENFENILEENDWFESESLCFDSRLHNFLQENNVTFTGDFEPTFFFTSCEALIADEGSILFSSKQLKHYKVDELPTDIVVYASTSQFSASKSDGLRKIKAKYEKEYPSNITAIKYFEKNAEEDFLTYGSCHKNLYLLLLEDL